MCAQNNYCTYADTSGSIHKIDAKFTIFSLQADFNLTYVNENACSCYVPNDLLSDLQPPRGVLVDGKSEKIRAGTCIRQRHKGNLRKYSVFHYKRNSNFKNLFKKKFYSHIWQHWMHCPRTSRNMIPVLVGQ